MNDLKIIYEKEKTDKESSAFLDAIQQIFDNGVMGYIAPEISDKAVDIKSLPSMEKSESEAKVSKASELLNKAKYSEYIRQHFSSYTKKDNGHALDYEAEYILAGKSSDRKNLNTVVDELIAMRTGCNMISLIGDTEKKAEAMMLATAIVGFTGMPVLVKITQLVILGMWALAEAITDVKALLEGGKIPPIKHSEEWTLSLTDIKAFNTSSIGGKKLERGMSYEEYLRVLLLAQNKTKQIMRSMDVIELNMQKNENPGFKIADCIVDIKINATYEADRFFVTFPFVRRYLGYDGGGYYFDIAQQFVY